MWFQQDGTTRDKIQDSSDFLQQFWFKCVRCLGGDYLVRLKISISKKLYDNIYIHKENNLIFQVTQKVQ